MQKPNIIVIGGFGVNQYAAPWLYELSKNYKFIDINCHNNFINFEASAVFLEDYLVDKNNIVLGYSLGGMFAINLAHAFPKRIKKIGLINSSAKFIQAANWHGINFSDWNYLRRRLIDSSINRFMNYFINLISYPKSDRVLFRSINYCSEVTKEHLINLLDLLSNSDLRQMLNELDSEVFSIYSSEDNLVPSTNPNILGKRYVLSNSNHLKLDTTELFKILKAELIC